MSNPKSTRVEWNEYVSKKYLNLLSSASTRGIIFDLSLKALEKVLKTKKCAYTGISLVPAFKHNHVSGQPTPINLLTIDRVDSSEGYTDENIVACTYRINCLKGDATLSELEGLSKNTKKLMERKK